MTHKNILAFGVESIGRFALNCDNSIIELSKEYGNLNDYTNYELFCGDIERVIGNIIKNDIILVCDMHPDYLTTSLAEKYLRIIENSKLEIIQHHYAHFASVMYENNLSEKCIGVIFDGTGYGSDGLSWGGEIFCGNEFEFERIFHFDYIEQPGSDAVIKEPWRMGLAYLEKAGIAFNEFEERIGIEKINVIKKMLADKINCPLTSSAGRLFDAISSITGICDFSIETAEAAIALEKSACSNIENLYSYSLKNASIIFTNIICEIFNDLKNKIDKSVISAKFHNTIANIIFESAILISEQYGIKNVIISGGCFQNKYLSNRIDKLFAGSDMRLIRNINLPCGDGNIAAGQAYLIQRRLENNN